MRWPQRTIWIKGALQAKGEVKPKAATPLDG